MIKIKSDFDPIKRTLCKGGSVLVYTSKAKIVDQDIYRQFKKYIDICRPIDNSEALEIINNISILIGGSDDLTDG